MKTVELVQGTPEWHEFRRTHYTASDAPAMLGISPYKTREELFAEKCLGIDREIDARTQAIMARGHEFEEAARPRVEEEVGEELYPVVGEWDENRMLSASMDGMTLGGELVWEHKTMNETIRAAVEKGEIPEIYRAQMEQQMLVAGSTRAIFSASNETEFVSIAYYSDPVMRARIIDGWAAFHQERATWQPKEADTPVVATPTESLPAVAVTVSGALTVGGNLPVFAAALRAFVDRIPAKPETDQEFADCEAACKALKKAEDALDAAETSALAQISDVEEMRRTVSGLKSLARTTRLATEKLVKAEKEARRAALVMDAKQQFGRHLEKLQLDIKGVRLIVPSPDFGAAIKGLSSLDSMKNKLTAALLEAQSQATAICGRVTNNLQALDSVRDYDFLFADRQELAYKDAETLELIIRQRIDEHKRAEAARMAAERERIRQEEEAKAKAAEAARMAAESKTKATSAPVEQEPAGNAKLKHPSEEEIVAAVAKCFGVGENIASSWLHEIFGAKK